VVGMAWIDARPILEAAGFSLDYAAIGDVAPALVTVSSLNPGAGQSVKKGSSITITFTI